MDSSFLQSAAWERFQKQAGASVMRHSGQLYIKKSTFLGDYLLASRCEIASTSTLPIKEKAMFLRLEPVDDSSLQQVKEFATSHRHALVPTVAVQPRQTILIDIQAPFETVLAGMKQKHRYNLRQAEKHHLDYEVHSQDLLKHFPRFWDLLSRTSSRQDFRTHSRSYYESMLSELEKSAMAHLLFVSKDGVDLASMILITYEGVATYLHGASSEDKQWRAPFLLHSQAMQFAQSLHCHTYDLWGTDLTFNSELNSWEPQEGKASAGTSRFKVGFGGQVITYPGTYDLILQPFCYTLYTLVRRLRGGKRAFS